MSSVAVKYQETPLDETPLQYTEEQLQSLYSDLFASLPSVAHHKPTTPDPMLPTLQSLQERFGIAGHIPYRRIIDHVQAALVFASGSNVRLGLLLDSEWETLIKAALDAGDLEYGLKGIEAMKSHGAALVENLDLRLLRDLDVADFPRVNDKLTEIGYPNTPERLSLFVNSHLRSQLTYQPSVQPIKGSQDLIHKLEAQGTPPSQTAYISVMRAYLYVSRDSNVLSDPSTNPSVAIAAVHDLFAHMRYAAHPEPSLEAYSLVISACGRGHRANPLRALELVQEIKQKLLGRTDDVDVHSLLVCYNGAIRACARGGQRFIGDAFRLAKELVQPDGIPVAGAVIAGIGPDRQTMAALMHAAKRVGDVARARWILTEIIRAQPLVPEPILDEEIMTCAFHAYSAFNPAFKRDMAREKVATEEPEALEEPSLGETSTYPLPQSGSEILLEADALYSRILSNQSGSPDPLFIKVPLGPRIANAYLSVYFSHASFERALAKFEEVHELIEPNAYTFIGILEWLARASKPNRYHAQKKAQRIWIEWQRWTQRVEAGDVNLELAETTPRAIERAWAAIIRVYSLCDDIDTALSLLREFVTKYPPSSLKHTDPTPAPIQQSRLEHPASSKRPLDALLATPAPRVGLLVRLSTPEQITEPGIGPHLLFADLALLHQRLVSRHSHRRADIAFVSWACKSYEFQLKRHREQTLGITKPPHPGDKPLEGKTGSSRR